MTRPPFISRMVLVTLLALAVLLPVAQGVLFWVRELLLAMEDELGAAIVGRLVLVAATVWIFDLIALILALAVNAMAEREDPLE